MDATPITYGQEFSGYSAQIRYGIERIMSAMPRIIELPLGGTAVDTGINAPKDFATRVIKILIKDIGIHLTEARNHFE